MSIKDRYEVLALLCARFPKTFFAYQRRRRPLKIGIHRELEAVLGETVERKLLHRAIRTYVVNYGYLQSQTAGAERIDLDGKPAGVVTEEEAENAKRTLAGINARRLEIKKQKRLEPRREARAASATGWRR